MALACHRHQVQPALQSHEEDLSPLVPAPASPSSRTTSDPFSLSPTPPPSHPPVARRATPPPSHAPPASRPASPRVHARVYRASVRHRRTRVSLASVHSVAHVMQRLDQPLPSLLFERRSDSETVHSDGPLKRWPTDHSNGLLKRFTERVHWNQAPARGPQVPDRIQHARVPRRRSKGCRLGHLRVGGDRLPPRSPPSLPSLPHTLSHTLPHTLPKWSATKVPIYLKFIRASSPTFPHTLAPSKFHVALILSHTTRSCPPLHI